MRSPINIEELLSGHRSLFLIDIPCHPSFVNKQVVLNKDFIKDFIKANESQLSERQVEIILIIAENDTLTSQKIAQKTGVT